MAALAVDRIAPERDLRDTAYPVAAAAKIYVGALVFLNATGFAEPASTAAGKIVAGVSRQQVDNTSGADGAVKVTVRRAAYKFINGDAIAEADLGKLAYAVDDQTVSKGAAGKSPVGVIVEVEADGVWVAVASRPAAAAAAADTAGAVLADLETEVNKVKAAIRKAGILTA
jgi:hypothetical protein